MCRMYRHAPCLLELSSGEMVEIALYQPHHTKAAETVPEETPWVMKFFPVGKARGWADTANQIGCIELPKGISLMGRSQFCHSCRKLLRGYAFAGYVIVDTYELHKPEVYPITDGASYEMRCYKVTVEKVDEVMTVTVLGSALPPVQ